MKNIKHIYSLFALAGIITLSACDDDKLAPGNPVMNPKTEINAALFGDSIPFTVSVEDLEVPLSTLKAQIFYGEEKVSETVIRTKTANDYSGKIFVPFYKDIPDGNATFKFVLQNINFTITEREYTLPLSRPDFPYLTFVTAQEEYRMEKTAGNQYAVTKDFPKEIEGYIVAPKVGENGNEIVFGWSNGAIVQDVKTNIKFLNALKGEYSIKFNTLTYEASPFFAFLFNNEPMEQKDEESYTTAGDFEKDQVIPVSGIVIDEWDLGGLFTKKSDEELVFNMPSGKYQIIANFAKKEFSYLQITSITIDLSGGSTVAEFAKGQKVIVTGIPDISDWWMDPDFFVAEGADYLFNAAYGKYKVTANATHKYLIVEAMRGDELATLQEDGTGAIWVIGDHVGKPTVADNQVGWSPDKALCMAPIGNKQYRLTVVAGSSVTKDEINFKFYYQKGWGDEFSHDKITTTSNVVFIGDGANGRDTGNLGIVEGKSLTEGKTYEFIIDLSQGVQKAVLSVNEI